MAHQLSQAYSACCSDSVHGHGYICELFLCSNVLDNTGMVIDFGEVKAKIGKYINSWDHCLVMPSTMPQEYLDMLKKYNKNIKIVDYNPTAENMARDMFLTIKREHRELPLQKIRLHETETGWAEYSEEDPYYADDI